MRGDPGVTTIISVNSPRRFDDMMAEGLMTMAEFGQSVAVTPFTLMGAMSPVTLAGALAQQNAEALFGIVLTQLVRPGAPVMYGAFTSNVDMRSGAPAFGTPENTKANIASGQLARRYNLPYRTTPGSASNAADAQGAYETMMALWGAVLGHGNLVYHAAGWQEGGLTASFEKFIIDVELIQHMMAFLAPIEVNEGELALEALGRVPTGGHFFGEQHTLERYSTAFYQPLLSNWQNYEAWAGSRQPRRHGARNQTVEEGAGGICRAGDGCCRAGVAGGLCRQAQGSDRRRRAVRETAVGGLASCYGIRRPRLKPDRMTTERASPQDRHRWRFARPALSSSGEDPCQ